MDKIESKFVTAYNRFLKAPLFRAQAKQGERKIVHKYKNIGEMIIETSADKLPDSSDFEKYLIIMYAIQMKRIKQFKARDEENIIFVEVPMSVFRELDRNDYQGIVKALKNIASVTVSFKGEKINKKGKKVELHTTTHIIHEVELNEDTNTLKVLLNKKLYENIYNKHKTLRVHLKDYLKLQGNAKNIYAILTGNSSKTQMNLQTIADRALVQNERQRDTIRSVKNALKTINDTTEIFKNKLEILQNKVKIIRRKKQQKKVQQTTPKNA